MVATASPHPTPEKDTVVDLEGRKPVNATYEDPRKKRFRSALPDGYVVVRGGVRPLPPVGEKFSGAVGVDKVDAGKGIPHGNMRSSTVGAIRGFGGTVESAPELSAGNVLNERHVDIIEGKTGAFGPLEPNPVPKAERIH
jgi:hypothetical protein